MNHSIEAVNISIGASMYGRFEDLTNTPSNVLAEFVDNALQSYRNNKELLHSLNADYQFSVNIEFIRDASGKELQKIRISDNAFGINEDRYQTAFMPAKTSADNSGLNEFGMGLKTAACWLGDFWEVKTKALNESEERTVQFDLNQVTANELDALPVEHSARPVTEHYTIITIDRLTKNAPKPQGIARIKRDLASIYRMSLREKEMRLIVDEDLLEYQEPEILEAPFYKDTDGPNVYWKKEINFEFGTYKAHGFIGILKEMSNQNNGFVLLRRGRVVKGAEDGQRYFPKSLCSEVGSPRYKRIFGELHLEGFKVSFNKNDILDKENLEALMEGLKGEIHTKEFDLYSQAGGYRVDERKKNIKKIVTKYKTAPKKACAPIEISTQATPQEPSLFPKPEPEPITPLVYDGYDVEYKINNIDYTMQVKFEDNGSDLVWVDVSKEEEHVIICHINTGHVFFEAFGKIDDATTAILKTIAIAKYTAKKNGENDASKMMQYFNEYIKHTKR